MKRVTHEEEGVAGGAGLRSGGSGRVQIAHGTDPGWGRDRVRQTGRRKDRGAGG